MIRVAKINKKDDSLYGLLSTYKSNATFARILVSEELKKIEVQITGNPKNWEKLNSEKYKSYRIMSRLEVGIEKLSIKFLNPYHLVEFFDPLLGIKISPEKVTVLDKLEMKNLYIISTSIKYKKKIIQGVKKIMNLGPQKKYEILEKSLVEIRKEKMTEQYNSLNEKTKLIETALKYCGGDMDKAKAMVSGQFQDLIVVKAKFVVPSIEQAGVFIAFINTIDEYISNITTLITSNAEIYEKVRIFDNWKTLYSDIMAYTKHSETIDATNFRNYLLDSFIGYDIFPDVQENNLDELTKSVFEILTKSFNATDVQCQLELGVTSSLAVELNGIDIEVPGGSESKEQALEVLSDADEEIKRIESSANYVISGEIIVAPVKGRYINDISIGDRIKVMLSNRDSVSSKILSVLKAIDSEGKISPIKGKVKAKIPLEKSGYIMYALVAKGVLAKIVEEENVKIQIDIPEVKAEESKKDDSKIIYLMLGIVVLIIIAGVILFSIL